MIKQNFWSGLLVLLILFVQSWSANAACDGIRHLPQSVDFRTKSATFNSRYDFILDNQWICFKPRNSSGPWQPIELPSSLYSLYGEINAISADDQYLVAVNENREVYTMVNALESPEKFQWTSKWGYPRWRGFGVFVPKDSIMWDISFFSPQLDQFYQDARGTHHEIGPGVTTLYVLRGDGRRITYLDPTLPADFSLGVCGPKRGRLKIKALSASGSTLFAMSQNGDLFIKRSDFDFSEFDSHLFYLLKKRTTPRMSYLGYELSPEYLPNSSWIQLAKIHGNISSVISVEKSGIGGRNRILKVEGKKRDETGYFEARFDFVDYEERLLALREQGLIGMSDLVQHAKIEWNFKPTQNPLLGKIIEDPETNTIPDPPTDTSEIDLGISEDRSYEGYLDPANKIKIRILDFNRYCSPARAQIWIEAAKTYRKPGRGPSLLEQPIPLIFHYADQIRYEARHENLNSDPVDMHGLLEVPEKIWANQSMLSQHHLKLIRKYFGNQRFIPVAIGLTDRGMKLKVKSRIRSLKYAYPETELFQLE